MGIEFLEPKECFYWFSHLLRIPHGSHNEKQLSDFLVGFAKERGLTVTQDALYNVCIKKAATPGMEKAPAVILQGHMDMVCVKEDGKNFDFTAQPIPAMVKDDSVTADGTTLGADNGIALALILALLDAKDIPHPAIEAVITTQEEVGMGGAAAFDVAQLAGAYFINLDSEDEGIFCTSCAGGRRSELVLPVEKAPAGHGQGSFFAVTVSGLAGGHSGMEIDKERGNAIRLMGRVLAALVEKFGCRLADIAGGSASNVIPSECSAVIFADADEASIRNELAALNAVLTNELQAADGGGLTLAVRSVAGKDTVFSEKTLRNIITAIALMPNGVLGMDLNITAQRLVETSNNLGVIAVGDKGVTLSCLTRSSVGSRKEFVYSQIAMIAELLGGSVSYFGDYPAWEFAAQSRLREVFLEAYRALYGNDAKVEGIHAGLECGLFYDKFKAAGRHVDFIALGPNIRGAHTVQETLSISSTAHTWALLKEALRLLGK